MTSSATLTWYGHSNMFLQSGDVSVLVDPFFEGNPLAPDWKTVPRPDIIAVTHDHGDHLGQAVPLALASGATVACIVELAPLFVEGAWTRPAWWAGMWTARWISGACA